MQFKFDADAKVTEHKPVRWDAEKGIWVEHDYPVLCIPPAPVDPAKRVDDERD